jgi:phage-related protein
MFEVEFYEDRRGRQPVKELLSELRDKAGASKDARIQYEKILTYIRALEEYGTRMGEPQVKHIDGALWELRPLAHRVLFFHWQANKLVLLHHFIKKTQKTPAKEIEQARHNMRDFLERSR